MADLTDRGTGEDEVGAELEPSEVDQDSSERMRLYREAIRQAEYPEILSKAFRSFQDPVRFAPGDLVEWKPLLRDRPYPAYGAPVVVVRYLEAGDRRREGVDIEPDDVALGLWTGDGEFILLPFPSHRFQNWRGHSPDQV